MPRGSEGGKARKAKLSKEERSAIAKLGAQKRWGKKEEASGLSGDPINQEPFVPEPSTCAIPYEGYLTDKSESSSGTEGTVTIHSDGIPADAPVLPHVYPTYGGINRTATHPEPPKRPRAKRKSVPKAFGAAHNYAEKRLAEAIKERAECMNKLAMLNAEIPSLVQIIKALGNNQIPVEAYQVGAVPMPSFTPTAAPVPVLPPLPPAPLAQGGAIGFDPAPEEREDQFLTESGPMGGGGWR